MQESEMNTEGWALIKLSQGIPYWDSEMQDPPTQSGVYKFRRVGKSTSIEITFNSQEGDIIRWMLRKGYYKVINFRKGMLSLIEKL